MSRIGELAVDDDGLFHGKVRQHLAWPRSTRSVQCSVMIRTWADGASRPFGEHGKATPYWGLDVEVAQATLAALDAATSLGDLSPKSVGLHALKRKRRGQWAMTVNGPWRICFRFKDGDADDVQIVDYHRG